MLRSNSIAPEKRHRCFSGQSHKIIPHLWRLMLGVQSLAFEVLCLRILCSELGQSAFFFFLPYAPYFPYIPIPYTILNSEFKVLPVNFFNTPASCERSEAIRFKYYHPSPLAFGVRSLEGSPFSLHYSPLTIHYSPFTIHRPLF